MDYKRIYDTLIERAKQRKVEGYTEKHHIIPKCMGGSDDKDNLVELTAREHFIVHKLLCEIYPENHKLQYALWMMCNAKGNKKQGRDYEISSIEYERLREVFSKNISNMNSGENHPLYGKKHSNETIKKQREAKIGKIVSDDTRRKLSEARRGMRFTEKHKKNLRKSHLGKTLSNETKRKIRKNKIEYYKNNDNHRKGIKLSNETREKISKNHADVSGKNNPRARKVKCLQEHCCGNGVYNTLKECGKSHNLKYYSISDHCRGRRKNNKFEFVR